MATFVTTTLLLLGPSCVAAAVMLPCDVCALTAARQLVPTPLDGFAINDESDTHAVTSVAVPCNRAVVLTSVDATAVPTTVTEALPVGDRLVNTIELTAGPRNEMAADIEPRCNRSVTATARDVPVPAPLLAATAVSEVHAVAVAEVDPTLWMGDAIATPLLKPTTVTLIDPVVATLTATTELPAIPANVTTDVCVPSRPVAVNVTRRLTPHPCGDLACNALSDVHNVDVHTDSPRRTTELAALSPRPAPTTVTLIEPVAGTLVTIVALTVRLEHVITDVNDPSRILDVTTTARDACGKVGICLPSMAVADTQCDDSVADPPTCEATQC